MLQVISYGFFGAALKKVRHFIKKRGFSGKLNRNSFLLHAFCFSLYLASGIVLCVSFFNYLVERTATAESVVRIHTVFVYLQFFAELSICVIYYEKKKKEVRRMSDYIPDDPERPSEVLRPDLLSAPFPNNADPGDVSTNDDLSSR